MFLAGPVVQGRPTTGAAGKKSRRGGRKGGAVHVTLPYTTAGATTSGIGPLSFVSSKVHVEIPEVTDAKDYLLSVANPVRDISAIKVRDGVAWKCCTRVFLGHRWPYFAMRGYTGNITVHNILVHSDVRS